MPSGCPTIYIPGIMGSQLYIPEDGRKLWFSAPAVLTDAKRLDIRSDLIVKNNGVNLQTQNPLEREHGVLRQDILLIEWLCRSMHDSPVYFFSYDFRKSCRENADKLNDLIELLKEDGYASVNIVCHSMGGLVTSAYAAKYGTSCLKRCVMLGVPFEGSYEVIRMYLTGDIREVPNLIAETVGITREMFAGYPGLAELMPSRESLAANPVLRKGKAMNPEEMELLLAALNPKTYADARIFQQDMQEGISRLLKMEKCYFGIGFGKPTLQTVSLPDEESELMRIENDNGDGLVSCFSATIGGKLLKLMQEENPRVKAFPVGHANLLRAPEALKWIGECIRDGTCLEP